MFVSVTVAPLTTAPLLSRMVPTTEAVSNWAQAGEHTLSATNNARSVRFMASPGWYIKSKKNRCRRLPGGCKHDKAWQSTYDDEKPEIGYVSSMVAI
jgi:hypothetical protein